jgi:hypothetical protein
MATCEFCGEATPAGAKLCPNCGMILRTDIDASSASEEIVPILVPDEEESERPPAGTPCLVLYGADRKPRAYFPLTKDAVVVGRLDPIAGSFPDIDLAEWLSPQEARRISREHAVVLHSRSNKQFTLRAVKGSVGTQLEAEMLDWDKPQSLLPGMRIILGGVARLKFEMT